MMQRIIALFACTALCWISTPSQSADISGAWKIDTRLTDGVRTSAANNGDPAERLRGNAGHRVEVPIHQIVLSDGTLRYSIPVRIGNSTPIEAMLDTGSTGLRILPGAISPTNYAMTPRANEYGYGSGVKITGMIANASVDIGGTVTDEPITIQVIQTVGCFENKPVCPASRVAQTAYGLGGDGLPNEGFKAIIGISMPLRGVNYDVVNPLLFLGQRIWVVILPLPGQSTPGKLIINPNSEDVAGFTSFTDLVAMPGFQQEAISACLHNQNSGSTFCGPVTLDTGAPAIIVNTSLGTPGAWTEGIRGSFSFGDAKGTPSKMDIMVSGVNPGHRVTIEPQAGQRPTIMNAGIIPFFSFAVLYDARNDAMGLKSRPLAWSVSDTNEQPARPLGHPDKAILRYRAAAELDKDNQAIAAQLAAQTSASMPDGMNYQFTPGLPGSHTLNVTIRKGASGPLIAQATLTADELWQVLHVPSLRARAGSNVVAKVARTTVTAFDMGAAQRQVH